MTNWLEDENGEYVVVANKEEQYSIWPTWREVPNGWIVAGPKGKRKDCLGWIGENWTDMRPKSLRQAGAVKSVQE